MKVGILGSGAVGLFYGCELERSGQEVHFLMRSDYEPALRRGIRIQKADEVYAIDPARVYRTSSEIGLCDLVVIALKTTSNSALPALLEPMVGPKTQLLTLQNGLGNGEFLASLYPKNPILVGMCFVCLNRTEPASVRNFLPGSVVIGPHRPEHLELAEALVEIFHAATVKVHLESNLKRAQWKKLMWNIPFNGFTIALGGKTTEDVLSSIEMTEEVRALMREVQAGAKAIGVEIEDSYIEWQIERTRPMGPYKPSSMIDFVEGRAVEVESIWGEPLRRANRQGAELPRLNFLYSLLKALCERG